MKLLIKAIWILVCTNCVLLFASNLRKEIDSEKIANLLMGTLLLNTAVPMYIMLNVKRDVYVTSMIAILVIYNIVMAVNRKKMSHYKDIRFIMMNLTIINFVIAVQLMVLEIERYDLLTHIFASYIVVQLIILFFCNIKNGFEKEKLMGYVSIFALANSALGLVQFYTGEAVLISWQKTLENNSGTSVGRAAGFAGVSNAAGNLGAILFPVLLYRFWKERTFFNFIVLIMDVAFTITTFTRTGYIGLFVETTVFLLFWMLKKSSREVVLKKILFVFSLVILAYLVYDIYMDDLVNMYVVWFGGRGKTYALRFAQFKEVFMTFLESPLIGVGSGQYVPYLMRTHAEYDLVIHSQWLDILVEQGAISFVCYMAFNISLFVLLLKKYWGKYKELGMVVAMFAGYNTVINFNTNHYAAINIYLFYIIVCGMLFSKESETGHESMESKG